MPRKKGVEKVATVVRFTPRAKRLLEKIAGMLGRPANVYLEDLILADAKRRRIEDDESPDDQ